MRGMVLSSRKRLNVMVYGVDEKSASVVTRLKTSHHYNVVGYLNYGKKLKGQTSNDMDIAIDYNKLKEMWDLPEWTGKRLEEWVDLAKEAADKCGVQFNMAATVCSLRWPIANADGEQENEFI